MKPPTVYDLKPGFQALLRPMVQALAKIGVTANQVTLFAMALSLILGGALAAYPQSSWLLLLLPPFLFVRMALNAIDGMLAREHKMQSPLGALLNELGDVVSDAALYLPLALVPGVSASFVASELIVLVVAGALISEMAGVAALQIGAARRYDGPMGKSDRALVFGILALALGLGAPPEIWLDLLLTVVLALSLLTTVNRCRQALREVR